MTKPRIGVPYHPKYANNAFYRTIGVLEKEHGFAIVKLDWQDFDENNSSTVVQRSQTIDGLLLPGAYYGLDLQLHGADERDKNHEKQFKTLLFHQALKKGMPILGICAGQWLMNLALGGRIELLPKEIKTAHDVFPLKGELAHFILVQEKTHLDGILRGNSKSNAPIVMQVNSWHDAAVSDIANGLQVSARSDDGVVEAIEIPYPGNPNCIGIQFHPEYLDPETTPMELLYQKRIFDAFRQSSLQFQRKRIVHADIRARFFGYPNEPALATESACGMEVKP